MITDSEVFDIDDERDTYRLREPLKKNPQSFRPPQPVPEQVDPEQRSYLTDWAKEHLAAARAKLEAPDAG